MLTQQSTRSIPTDAIAALLERAIIMGEFRPRERLIEMTLSRRFASNRSRIRSALRILGEKGLVFLTPGRGAAVAEYTPKQVRDMYQVRQILESAALDLALPRITPSTIKTLRSLARRFSGAVQRYDFATLKQCNDSFHRHLLQAAGNDTLSQMIEQLWLRCYLVRYFAWLNRERLKASAAEHTRIVDLLEQGDTKSLIPIFARHSIGGRDVYLQQVEAVLGGNGTSSRSSRDKAPRERRAVRPSRSRTASRSRDTRSELF